MAASTTSANTGGLQPAQKIKPKPKPVPHVMQKPGTKY